MYIKHQQNNLSYPIAEHYTKYQFSESGTARLGLCHSNITIL